MMDEAPSAAPAADQMSVLEAEVAKIKAKLFPPTEAPDAHAVHMANFESMKAKRAAYKASWPAEDEAYAAEVAAHRKSVMDSFDRGLAAFIATTNIQAEWDDPAPHEDAPAQDHPPAA